jgi:hypothetical protein
MKLIFDTAAVRAIRILIVMGVLAALCISRNVGLELLPLPISEPVATYNQPQVNSTPAPNSNAPPSAGFISSRVEMTAPRVSGAATQLQFESHEPANVSSTCDISETTFLSVRDKHALSFYDFVFAFRPGGRSPPHLA